jgi:hypothetical protein
VTTKPAKAILCLSNSGTAMLRLLRMLPLLMSITPS